MSKPNCWFTWWIRHRRRTEEKKSPHAWPGEREILMFLAKTSLHYPIPYQVKCTTLLGNVGREYYPIRQGLLSQTSCVPISCRQLEETFAPQNYLTLRISVAPMSRSHDELLDCRSFKRVETSLCYILISHSDGACLSYLLTVRSVS